VTEVVPERSWHGGCRSRWIPVFFIETAKGGAGTSRHARDLQHGSGAASSPRPSSSRCWSPAISISAWMAKVRSGTISPSRPTNTRRLTCVPMPACDRPGPGLSGIWPSTTHAVRIHHLTGEPPNKPIPTSRCLKRWQHNPGGNPLRKRLETVQTNRTTSQRSAAGKFFVRRRTLGRKLT